MFICIPCFNIAHAAWLLLPVYYCTVGCSKSSLYGKRIQSWTGLINYSRTKRNYWIWLIKTKLLRQENNEFQLKTLDKQNYQIQLKNLTKQAN